jgi:hypothetical protein
MKALLAAAVVIVLCGSYVGSYLALSVPSPLHVAVMGERSAGGLSKCVGRTQRFRVEHPAIDWLYFPLTFIDHCVRREYWVHSDI